MGGANAGLGGSDVGNPGLGGNEPRPKPQDVCGNNVDPLAGVPVGTANEAALKASALAYYLDGMISSSGVDPSNQAAVAALLVQNGSMAEMVVDNWIATVDPSTIPTTGDQPMPQCLDLRAYPGRLSGPVARQRGARFLRQNRTEQTGSADLAG